MFCDRQNIEYNLLKAACGCFSHKASLNNIVAILTFIYVLSNGFQRIMHKFSSLQFMNMFTKGNLSIDVRASRLQGGNEMYENIIDAIEDIVDTINNDGGWTLYGWGKRGLINDSSLLEFDSKEPEEKKILSQEVSTHIVHIHPTNRKYMNGDTEEGKKLHGMKFDLSTVI